MFRKSTITHLEHYIRSTLQKIEVKPGLLRYNYQCHSNAVHDALTNNEHRLALCIYFEDNEPCVHFINLSHDNVYVDNTLGVWATKCEYYLVRHIHCSEFWDVYSIHNSYRMHLKSLLPFWLRLFHHHKSI